MAAAPGKGGIGRVWVQRLQLFQSHLATVQADDVKQGLRDGSAAEDGLLERQLVGEHPLVGRRPQERAAVQVGVKGLPEQALEGWSSRGVVQQAERDPAQRCGVGAFQGERPAGASRGRPGVGMADGAWRGCQPLPDARGTDVVGLVPPVVVKPAVGRLQVGGGIQCKHDAWNEGRVMVMIQPGDDLTVRVLERGEQVRAGEHAQQFIRHGRIARPAPVSAGLIAPLVRGLTRPAEVRDRGIQIQADRLFGRSRRAGQDLPGQQPIVITVRAVDGLPVCLQQRHDSPGAQGDRGDLSNWRGRQPRGVGRIGQETRVHVRVGAVNGSARCRRGARIGLV